MIKEIKEEKENVIALMIERDKIKSELNFYKSVWEELKNILNGSIQSSWSAYKKTKLDRWGYYAESDSAVLERMKELEGANNGI